MNLTVSVNPLTGVFIMARSPCACVAVRFGIVFTQAATLYVMDLGADGASLVAS